MLTDASLLPDGTSITADVCVVGAGPAGIALARELQKQAVRVCLVESGGLEADEDAQRLTSIPRAGGDLTFPSGSRRRQFGGTATVWNAPIPGNRQGVRMLPLDPLDFEQREWVEDSGWPIAYGDLDAYYRRAQSLLELKPTGSDAGPWPDAPDPWPLDPDKVQTTMVQFARRPALLRRGKEVLDSEVQVLLRANVTDFELAQDRLSVSRLRVACFNGKRHSVTASVFVLATGGIENARLLRLCEGGVRDLVGRYFMDHVWASIGTVTLADPAAFAASALYDIVRVHGHLVGGRLRLSDDAMRSEGLLNGAVTITPRPSPEHLQAIEGLRFFKRRGHYGENVGYLEALRRVARGGPYAAALTAELAWRQRRFPPTISSGWAQLRRGGHRLPHFDLELQLELPPRRENQIVLAERHDALGLPVACVRYEFGDLERRTLHRTSELMAEAIEDAGIGQVSHRARASDLVSGESIHHHMGTTRMHESPARGVVDPNCRVHGVKNLYVAGSSVFPTGGYANPTLTIIALALRLADHLAA